MHYQIVIVGAGISGAVLAERYAAIGKKVLILEKRKHIGGNCYDYVNEHGILVSKYGAHLFHTDFENVWQYVRRFSDWRPYEHRVKAFVDGKLVPVPVNITTVNELLGLNIRDEEEMKLWLKTVQVPNEHSKNSEQTALARVGPVLYEKIFKNYTKKQWDKYPYELNPEVLQRIPVRTNFDDRYFSDIHQALPEQGYAKLFEQMLNHPNITVELEKDFFDHRAQYEGKCEKLFYTGPIDQFFDFKFSVGRQLEYRSLDFVFETYPKEWYQENSVINYPNDYQFTRIVEFKHFPNQPPSARREPPKTTISREFSSATGEPYYPVPNPVNQQIYGLYQQAAENLKGVYFVGRLANYKYFNMDQAFKNALDLFERLEREDNT